MERFLTKSGQLLRGERPLAGPRSPLDDLRGMRVGVFVLRGLEGLLGLPVCSGFELGHNLKRACVVGQGPGQEKHLNP